jgi:hypothetical protein
MLRPGGQESRLRVLDLAREEGDECVAGRVARPGWVTQLLVQS